MSSVVAVQVPANVHPGGQFMVRSATGQTMVAQVPFGVMPGQMMYVRMPAPPPIPVVMVQEQAAPPERQDTKVVEASYNPTTLEEAPSPDDLIPCFGCCCAICSLYTKIPNCVGVFAKGVCGCCDVEGVLCKPATHKGPKSLLICSKGECELIIPEVCFKFNYQCCCGDSRCAFPCDEEVPCVLAACGVQCAKNFQCACGVAEKIGAGDKKQESV